MINGVAADKVLLSLKLMDGLCYNAFNTYLFDRKKVPPC